MLYLTKGGIQKMTALEALQELMKIVPDFETHVDLFDTIKEELASKTADVETVDLSEYVDVKTYNDLKDKYIQRFGEITENHIDVEKTEVKEPDYANMDFSYGIFDGSTE